MLKTLSCVIVVGGVEHRFSGPVSRALQPLCGIPIVGHLIETLESLGVKNITVVSNAKGLEEYLGRRAVHIHREGTRGSGDALYMAKSRIEEFSDDVLVVYGDRPLLKPATIEKMVYAAENAGVDCAFLTVVMNDPHGHARVIRSADGGVERTGRDCEILTAEGKIREVIGGAYYFRRNALLDAFKELKPAEAVQFYVTDITSWFAARKQVVTLTVADPREVQGVYSFQDLATAEILMQGRILDRWMREGVRIVDPRTTSIGAEARIGADTIIYPNTVIEGPCEIGRGCSLGPFARIRPGVVIGDGVRIGNFVEVVRSHVGDRTRILHLSFIGDAVIESDVNIGAGTITANSDGMSTHKTIIEQNARIGSGTILVAPVKVGRGAGTGSGAVVTKNHDVHNGETVVGIPAKPLTKASGQPRPS
jgi:bifunctional UDP-N-acetylglucosamine pyrophosphorylase/glucosamine-1-phosphate N-acetyltransferase